MYIYIYISGAPSLYFSLAFSIHSLFVKNSMSRRAFPFDSSRLEPSPSEKSTRCYSLRRYEYTSSRIRLASAGVSVMEEYIGKEDSVRHSASSPNRKETGCVCVCAQGCRFGLVIAAVKRIKKRHKSVEIL